MHSDHIYQLREVLPAVSVSTEEPGVQLGRPDKLQRILVTTFICLEATHGNRINGFFIMHMYDEYI